MAPPGGLLLGPCVSPSPVLILAHHALWPTNLIFLAGNWVVSVLGEVDGVVVSRSPLH